MSRDSAKKAQPKAPKDPFWYRHMRLLREELRKAGRRQDELRTALSDLNGGRKLPPYKIGFEHFRRVIQGRERRPLHYLEFLNDICEILASYHPVADLSMKRDYYRSLLLRTDEEDSIEGLREKGRVSLQNNLTLLPAAGYPFIERAKPRRIFVPCWGTTNPAFEEPGGDFYTGLPPLKISSDGRLDIDPTILLVADELVFDKSSADAIFQREEPTCARLQETLRVLRDEGFVTFEDFGRVIRNQENEFHSDLNRELLRVEAWLPLVRKSIDQWDEIAKRQKGALSEGQHSLLNLEPGAVASAVVAVDLKFISRDVKRVRRAIFSDEPGLMDWEIRARKAAVAAWVGPTISNLLIGAATEIPPLDWETMDAFYKAKTYGTENRLKEEVDKLQQFFNLALPQLKPKSAEQLVEILKDERSRDFRRMIAEAAADGTLIDQEFGRRAIAAGLRLRKTSDTVHATASVRTSVGLDDALAWLFCLIDHT